jgi:hypothetical protein
MDFRIAALWALVGWCGTPWPRPWPWPPSVDRPLNPWVSKLVGVVGGLLGGWVFSLLWPVGGSWTAIDAAATAVGAWVGVITLSNLVAIGTWPTPEEPRTEVDSG